MADHDVTQDDDLVDFTVRSISLLGQVRRVYVSGDGPGVIVMHEMPGISPHVARFARWVRDRGMTVYLPSLFGTDGALGDADSGAQVFRRLRREGVPRSRRWRVEPHHDVVDGPRSLGAP
ncbi:dienelactone hydrolase family protein [Streptomyces sp. NPDC020403]|uniref:dienelactone hydrolase family protein n=1 Tax=unclassified Streptomyces TaxID=2593676 RepID=UPI0033CFEEDC